MRQLFPGLPRREPRAHGQTSTRWKDYPTAPSKTAAWPRPPRAQLESWRCYQNRPSAESSFNKVNTTRIKRSTQIEAVRSCFPSSHGLPFPTGPGCYRSQSQRGLRPPRVVSPRTTLGNPCQPRLNRSGLWSRCDGRRKAHSSRPGLCCPKSLRDSRNSLSEMHVMISHPMRGPRQATPSFDSPQQTAKLKANFMGGNRFSMGLSVLNFTMSNITAFQSIRVLQKQVTKHAIQQLWLEPGAFRRHNSARVGDAHQLFNAGGKHRERARIVPFVDQPSNSRDRESPQRNSYACWCADRNSEIGSRTYFCKSVTSSFSTDPW